VTSLKIDLHIHSQYSTDGLSKPESIVKRAKKKGLDGIAITDHNNTQAWKPLLSLAK